MIASQYSGLDLNGSTEKKELLFNRVTGYEVKLPENTVAKARKHAKIRKKNHKHHNKSDFNDKADFIGLFGECIFAKAFGLEVDWEIKLRDELDFEVGDILIDVKSTEYSPYLSVKCHRLHTDYIYVFCVCRTEFNDGKIVGWLNGSDVLKLGKKIKENVEEPYWKVSFTKLNKYSITSG